MLQDALGNWVDAIFIVLVCASTLLAFLRGVVQEVSVLTAWILAFLAAGQFADVGANLLPNSLEVSLRMPLGFLIIFLIVLVVVQWIGSALTLLTQAVGLSIFNRLLGAGFGLVRGLFVVGLLAMLAALSGLPKQEAWQEAWSRPVLELAISILTPWVPSMLAHRMDLAT